MNKFIRLASMTALLATSALVATGCECTDQGTNEAGQNVTQCESVQKFVGTSYTETVAYSDGYALNFDGVNGDVTVRIGNGTDVVVDITPFSVRGHSKEAEAKEDMETDLQTSVTGDGSINVTVGRASGSFNGLGADVVITLPSSFNGPVNIDQDNGFVDVDLGGATPTAVTIDNDGAGDVDVEGARGQLNITGGFDVSVVVAEWAPEGQNGEIKSDGQLGEVSITLPTLSAGSIQATSEDGLVIGPSSLPSNWVEEAAGENSKTFSFGLAAAGEPGAIVVMNGAKDVTINAN